MSATRDFFHWAKRRTLVALFSNPAFRDQLVLKGGNLLDIAFQVSTRSSVDLDFSIDGEFTEISCVRDQCEGVLRSAFENQGYAVIDVTVDERPPQLSDDLRDFWGGYRIGFKLVAAKLFEKHKGSIGDLRRNAVPMTDAGSTIFRIDVSKHEYCAEKQAFNVDGYQIFGYSPEMAIAEKLRAICQQMPAYRGKVHKHLAGRARDFLDIYTIKQAYLINFENPDFHALMKKVFAAKRVPIDLISQISQFREDHRPDFAAVQATVQSDVRLEGFDYYVDFVVRECRALEALWNE